jgi:hypothetical protein
MKIEIKKFCCHEPNHIDWDSDPICMGCNTFLDGLHLGKNDKIHPHPPLQYALMLCICCALVVHVSLPYPKSLS